MSVHSIARLAGRGNHVAWLVLFLAMSLLAYWAALDHGLVWDSLSYVAGNPHIKEISLDNLRWMFTSLCCSNWHPVTWVSYALDVWWFEDWVQGMHLTNILLHGINGWLVYLLLVRLMRVCGGSGPADAEGRAGIYLACAISALVFLLHPIHVESVAWVAERKDLLFFQFLLLSALCYLRMIESEHRYGLWLVLSVICFGIALMSKPMAVTFPAALVILDVLVLERLPLGRVFTPWRWHASEWRVVAEKLPFVLLALVVVVITLRAQSGAIIGTDHFPPEVRLLNATDALMFYIRSALLPIGFSPFYPHFATRWDDLELSRVVLPMVGVLVVTLLVLWLALFRQRRLWLAGWLFYIVSLSPVLGLVQAGLQGVADRYAYYVLLPLHGLIAWGLLRLWQRGAVIGRSILLAASMGILALLLVLTQRQVEHWRSELTLWAEALNQFPESSYILANLGQNLNQLGDYERSVEMFEAALRSEGYMRLVQIPILIRSYLRVGRYEAAYRMTRMHLEQHHPSELDPVDLNCMRFNLQQLQAWKDGAPPPTQDQLCFESSSVGWKEK